jgi:hypothetical protein
MGKVPNNIFSIVLAATNSQPILSITYFAYVAGVFSNGFVRGPSHVPVTMLLPTFLSERHLWMSFPGSNNVASL